MGKEPSKPLSEDALMVLLRARYTAPEYAFLPHVRNGTGSARRMTRTADALAMSLWPSRGLELHGLEIKSDRGDWLREKVAPEKAEEIAQFCDRWWLVVADERIIQPGELPPTWGLLVPRGSKLVAKVEPQKLQAKPMDRAQLAAILRRAADCVVPKAEIQEELAAARKAGIEEESQRTRWAAKEHDKLKTQIAAFEQASGVEIYSWDSGKKIGEAVRAVLDGEYRHVERRLLGLHEIANQIATDLAVRLSRLRSGAEPRPKGG